MSVAYTQEALTVSTSSVGFTASKLLNGSRHCSKVVFHVQDQPVRLQYDSTAPTSTTGIKLDPGAVYELSGEANIVNARFIRDTSSTGSATINCVFEES